VTKRDIATKSAEARVISLLQDIRGLIEAARQRAIQAVNAEMTLLYWHIGERINTEVLAGKRADYGDTIVATLSRQLASHYGRGFAEKSLRRMLQFAATFPDLEIVATLSRQLSWSHIIETLPLKDVVQREFYIQMCIAERWSVRALRDRIDSMLFERTALSRQPQAMIEAELTALRDRQCMSPALLMQDPYVLDFLDLQDTWAESDLEAAVLREMEAFLLELGDGFSFVSRQKRIQLDGDDFYLDLLFYNRRLRRLVAWNSRLAISRRHTRAKWSYIFAGSTNSNANQARRCPWESSYALARNASRLNCWSWKSQVSMSPSM
jgi:predicted nuclease of restriction endonuclease-like (RecB) superfamily